MDTLNKCGKKCSKLYLQLQAWIEVDKENSQSRFGTGDLMVLYPYVASLLHNIDALYIDGCLHTSEVRYAKRNLAFAIKRYKQLL